MTEPQRYVFTFYTDDPDPESIMYGCTAATLEEAETLVRAAGYREFTLYEQRALSPDETTDAANERILGNPFLGPQWLPLVETIELLTGNLRMGKFWILTTYGAAYGHDPYRSPYVQAMHESDGSLHLEVSGRNTEESPLTPQQHNELVFLGWDAPVPSVFVASETDAAERAHFAIPNSHRVFAPGWNARAIAEFFLETLTMIFQITDKDLFNFGENRQDDVARLGALEQMGDGPIFGLPTPDVIEAANPVPGSAFTDRVTAAAPTDPDGEVGPESPSVAALIRRIRNMTHLEALSFADLSIDLVETARETNSNVGHGLVQETGRQAAWKAAWDAALATCREWLGWGETPEGQDAATSHDPGMLHSIAYPSIWAAQALVMRDILIERGLDDDTIPDPYDLMTEPWRRVMGKVHESDPRNQTELSGSQTVEDELRASTTAGREEFTHPLPPASITLIVPLFYAGSEFVHPIAEDLLAALPGGQRIVFDASHAFGGYTRYPLRDVLTRVAAEGIEAVADWLATEARGQTILVLVTVDEFTGTNGEARNILRLAEFLSDRDVASLICAPTLTDSPGSALATGTVASSDRVMTIVCVALDRIDPEFEQLHVQALAVLKAFAGDRLSAFANRFELDASVEGFPTDCAHLGAVPVQISEFGFDAAHKARVGYAAARRFAGLRADRPQPAGLYYDTGEAIRILHAGDGLVLPYIPETFTDALRNLSSEQFGKATTRPYPPEWLYMLQEPLKDILEGDWQPKLQFGFNGQGMNSSAYTYLLVADGVAVLCQAFRGFLSADLRRTEREWAQLMDGAQRVHQAARDQGGIPAGKLLLVIWSGIRRLTGWVMLDRDNLNDHAHHKFSDEEHDLAEVFESAIWEGLGQLSVDPRANEENKAVRRAEKDTEDENDDDDVLDEFFDAQDVYMALEEAGLVDEEGLPNPDFLSEGYSRHEQFLYAEGKKNDHSYFSGDDIDGYFLEIDTWDEEDTDACSRLVSDKHSTDEDVLVGLAGPRWSVVLRRGDKDASIPKDISRKLLEAVDGSVLVWQKPIPDAEWFTSKYSLASEIIEVLGRKHSLVRVENPLSADGGKDLDEYIRESALDDTFATATLQIDSTICVTLHILIENHWAHKNPGWLEAYMPCSWKNAAVAGNGWVVRIVGDPQGLLESSLVPVARDLQAALGGNIFKEGQQVTP